MGMLGLRDVFVVAPAASFNHHHHQHHEQINLSTADPINASNATALGVGVGVGVIPLLPSAPCLTPLNMDDQDLLNNGRNKISGIHQFWQNQGSQYIKKASNTTPSILDHHNMSSTANLLLQSGNGGGNGSGNLGGNSSSSATTTCEDCGNQAKKDCSHRRCRTCCKSRGFDCSTHVKSTWVAAARRRERQLIATAGGGAGSTGSTSGSKKPRLINSQTTTTSHTSTSNTTPPRSYDTSSSHQDAGFKERFPGQVTAPAVFRCVRVTAVEDGEDEYAYQAVVKIGGHVFKGFLYDHGIETRDGFPNISELHLGGAGDGTGRHGASSSSPILDPSAVYGASAGGLLAVWFPPARSKCGNRHYCAALDFSMRSSCHVAIIYCQTRKSIAWMSFSSHFATCNIFVMRTTMESHAHIHIWCPWSFWYLKCTPSILNLFLAFISSFRV